MRNAERKKEGRILNSEFGMRNAERKKEVGRQSLEFGMRNSGCGNREVTHDRDMMTESMAHSL